MAVVSVGEAVLSAFLRVVFNRVASSDILDYLKRRKLIDRLVQKLKIELMSADAVLIDAEEKQITNPAVKEWLDELKDAVYVADDLLDEIAYEALRCKLEAESTSKVSGFISTFVNSFDKRIQSKLEKILECLKDITEKRNILGLKEVAGGVLALPSPRLTTSCPEKCGLAEEWSMVPQSVSAFSSSTCWPEGWAAYLPFFAEQCIDEDCPMLKERCCKKKKILSRELDDTGSFEGEKTAGPNNYSVRRYEVVDDIKAKLEKLGGPSWKDSLGRRDSTIANITAANTFIPAPMSNPSGLKAIFSAQGLSFKNMVALSGNSV
ncbi:putative disease resistance rpp13-like protein 1 [Fagus crenata]